MEQGLFFLADSISDNSYAKAKLKYELKQLEYILQQQVATQVHLQQCPDEIKQLCAVLVTKYCAYLHLMDFSFTVDYFATLTPQPNSYWLDNYHQLLQLKKQLIYVTALDERRNLIITIASLYYRIKEYSPQAYAKQSVSVETENNELYQLFVSADLKLWLLGLIKLWNQAICNIPATLTMMQEWSIAQQHYVLDFFSAPECVQFINSIFFYKAYPERLFDKNLHPEKLISLRARLEFIHRNIEHMQQTLFQLAEKNGLSYRVDYLLHNDTLPPGINLEVNADYNDLIQQAIRLVKMPQGGEATSTTAQTLLHDLLAAYKYWFAPNRLIDTVMLLKQQQTASFAEYLHSFYQQLTTVECLDLYGYFANKDTEYLLRALDLAINIPHSLKWLHGLTEHHKQTIRLVFSTLMTVMETLRTELSHRSLSTTPYNYVTVKDSIVIGKRNRNAVLRVVDIYRHEEEPINQSLEQLFLGLERMQNQTEDAGGA